MSERVDESDRSGVLTAAAVEWFINFHQSAESVTERRVALRQWATSIAFAISGGVGLLLSWGVEHPTYFAHAAIISLGLCVFGAIYCGFWGQSFDSYRLLNAAKYQVIAEMAGNFSSSDLPPELRGVFNSLEREYAVLKNTMGIRTLRRSSFSYERLLPSLFGWVFAVIAPLGILYALSELTLGVNWRQIVSGIG